jgi:hypothetical protein
MIIDDAVVANRIFSHETVLLAKHGIPFGSCDKLTPLRFNQLLLAINKSKSK